VANQPIFKSRGLPAPGARGCEPEVNALRGKPGWNRFQAPSIFGLWLTLGLPFLLAQTVPTVRETEFRSRWVDLQVDRPREEVHPEKPEASAEPESVPRMVAAVRSFFRNSPVDLRGGLSAGWEYSNEYSSFQPDKNTSNSSFFVAPVIAAFYDRDIGPWTVSARYSAGYVYYFDDNYYPGTGANTLPSQTAGLDLRLERARLRVQSNAAGSYGSGFDIERGDQTERLALSESLAADYQLTEYLRTGVAGSAGYEHYSGESGGFDDRHTRLAGTLYGDYFWTGKTRLRLELGTGSESQDNASSSVLDRTYAQALMRAYIQWSEKVYIEAGAGLALFEESGIDGASEEGLRPVYQVSIAYTPRKRPRSAFSPVGRRPRSHPTFHSGKLAAAPQHERDAFDLSTGQSLDGGFRSGSDRARGAPEFRAAHLSTDRCWSWGRHRAGGISRRRRSATALEWRSLLLRLHLAGLGSKPLAPLAGALANLLAAGFRADRG
jgi:hypothetical protein